MNKHLHLISLLIVAYFLTNGLQVQAQKWSPEQVYYGSGGKLSYTPDEDGNVIPDFSHVGYMYGDEPIPDLSVVVEVNPVEGDDRLNIQSAINQVAAMVPDANGFRGAVLLKKGTYQVEGKLYLKRSGIVLRGEGQTEEGTVIVAEGNDRRDFIVVGNGSGRSVDLFTKTNVAENFVPLGRKFVVVEDASDYQKGDNITVFRPGTEKWISDIKMDQIPNDDGQTKQWAPGSYSFHYERLVTKVSGDTIYFRNPLVMAMEARYGGGMVFKASSDRIEKVGVEDILLKSAYDSEFDEEHAWVGILFDCVEHSWARRVTTKYFGYACVSVSGPARQITIEDCHSIDPKSEIAGGHRYSFNIGNGSMILFKNCTTTEGRHDFVTGSRVCGPNVFTNCKASRVHADSGPHHRWATGTLYDKITTDGKINVQDRGQSGSGHGWAGANQVLWNCKGAGSICQSPWTSAKNYNFGFIGKKETGNKSRPDGVWVGHNRPGIFPESLYEAQLDSRVNDKRIFSVYPNLKKVSDSTFVLSMNMPYISIFASANNFSVGGDTGLEAEIFSVTALNDTSVLVAFNDIGLLPANSTLIVDVENIRNFDMKPIEGMNSASYTEPDLRPIVIGETASVNNEDGALEASSSRPGTIYIIAFDDDENLEDLYQSASDLDDAVRKFKGQKAAAPLSNTPVLISANGLAGGYYVYYAVDEDGRISEPLLAWPEVIATGPVNVAPEFLLYPDLQKKSDSSFVFLFSMPFMEDMLIQENFSISGDAGFEGLDFSLTALSDTSVLIVFDGIGLLPANSSVVIRVESILNTSGDALDGPKEASYIEPDLRPLVSGDAGTVNNEDGSLEAWSTKPGTIYVIAYFEDPNFADYYQTVSDLDQAVSENRGRKVEASVADVPVTISTKGLPGGFYAYFAVDEDGRVSEPGNAWPEVLATGPVAIDRVHLTKGFRVWSSKGTVFIQPDDNSAKYSARIYDITGRLYKVLGNKYGRQEVKVQSSGAIMLVKLISENDMSVGAYKIFYQP